MIEICQKANKQTKKQEKYFKGKVVIFTVQSLTLVLLTFLELHLKSFKGLIMGKFGLACAICHSNLDLTVKKLAYLREMRIIACVSTSS